MSRIQEEEPQMASRRPSPVNAVAPRRSKLSHAANTSVTKAKRSASMITTTKARSKRATNASSDDQKQWNIDLLKKWLEPVVIVTHIWQKLSNVEREVTLIVTHFWQLFSQIFGENLLIVTHIWPNRV